MKKNKEFIEFFGEGDIPEDVKKKLQETIDKMSKKDIDKIIKEKE